MIWRILRSRSYIPILLILGAFLYWKLHPGTPKAISVGYVADRDVILWNTLAQVRAPVSEVHYGDRVEVLRVEGVASQVRTVSGTIGWMRDSRQIMGSELWGKSAALLEKARQLPVQARGRTKTITNVRVEPGRDGERIFQFPRGTPVVILQRAVADASQGPEENAPDEKSGASENQKSKQEGWALVLRVEDAPASGESASASASPAGPVKPTTADAVGSGPLAAQASSAGLVGTSGPVAGWVLARFLELDLPEPVKDYASSADLRVIAWFELNRVPDGNGGEAPQYLVAGSRGAESQDCDFTMLRVYTWGKARKRYETAYVESDVCGRLPIRVSNGEKGPEFRFADEDTAEGERTYGMVQTVVRRLKKPGSQSSNPRRR
jgi:hypothetical protein